MEVKFKKDLHHSYMVIDVEQDMSASEYCIKLLEHQEVEGILPLERRVINNQKMLYYEITSKQVMQSLFLKANLTFEQLKKLCEHILMIMERAYEYLLPEDDFILKPEYIYLKVNDFQPELCFFPGYQTNIKDQIRSLMEYLMNKIDYTDKDAVLLVYQLYAISREENYRFEDLRELLLNGIDQNTKEQYKGRKYSGEQDDKEPYEERLNKEEQYKDEQSKEGEYKEEECKEGRYIKQQQKIVRKHNDIVNQKEDKNNESDKNITKQIFAKSTAKKDLGREQIEHQKAAKADKTQTQKRIPAIEEKIEGEKEVTVYPLRTYLYLLGCILGGIAVTVLCLLSKVLFNSFGNRIDYSKLFAFCLILLCVEGYLIQKILDKRNRITKMAKTQEYINIDVESFSRKQMEREGRREALLIKKDLLNKKDWLDEERLNKNEASNKSAGTNAANMNEVNCKEANKKVINNTVIEFELERKNRTLTDESEIRLECGKIPKKNVNIIDHIDHKYHNETLVNENQRLSDQDKSNGIGGKKKEDNPDQSYNPTCLLNEELRNPEICILKSFQGAYPDIMIEHYPFFIGKFRNNVDYCIEKDVISRYHAKVTQEGEDYFLTDLNSTNGTYLNGEMLLTYQKKEVKFGDEITFADLKYVFLKA